MSLIEHLQQVPDYRTRPHYPLWVVMLLVIMGIMSGCQGYRALEHFVQRHQRALLELMELPYSRLPSFSTLRRVMIRINFVALTKAFNQWAAATFEVAAGEQFATDGKSIKASVKDYDQSYQDFVSVVSAFSTSQGIVLGLEPMSNLSSSEIVTVQSLLEVLAVKGVCFSMDALHTQKKTVQQIVESGNDYLIAVKGNQPKLYQEISNQFESGDNGDTNIQTDNSHGRIVTRTVNVSDRVERIATDWVGVSRIIGVERTGLRDGKPFAEKVYDLSSVADNALGFASRIREHWPVENRRHWVKDVVLSEDRRPVCDGYAIANFAILRTMAINLLRREGFSSITKGLRFLAHDLNRLFSCCQS